jgi:hypothetical protein
LTVWRQNTIGYFFFFFFFSFLVCLSIVVHHRTTKLFLLSVFLLPYSNLYILAYWITDEKIYPIQNIIFLSLTITAHMFKVLLRFFSSFYMCIYEKLSVKSTLTDDRSWSYVMKERESRAVKTDSSDVVCLLSKWICGEILLLLTAKLSMLRNSRKKNYHMRWRWRWEEKEQTSMLENDGKKEWECFAVNTRS